MRRSPPTRQLTVEDLPRYRHVSALVDGPDEAFELLLPFILDGFEQGDRSFHIVDPQTRDAYLERLGASGIDVAAVMASRQLEVRTWDDSYQLGGQFDGSAQIEYLRRSLGEGPGLGYPRTRLIASTDWANDEETVHNLLAYEARVDIVLQKLPNVVICLYDVNRQTARTIANVLVVHPVALVGGELRASGMTARVSARERILTAASQLFYERGIQATGVDAIITSAGVAKATFYRHFPSKDDLVVAWLRDPRTRWFDAVRGQVETSDAKGAEAIQLYFEAVAEWLEAEGFRGCPYLNTGVEITDPTHLAQQVIRDSLQEIEDYLHRVIVAAGYRDARALAVELQTLVAGSISLAVARRSTASVVAARHAALSLLAGTARD